MARELFGTDGLRGRAGHFLTAELALKLARAAVQRVEGERPQVLIIRDTRESGEMLESAIAAGVTAGAGDALLAGVLPTPAAPLLLTRHGLEFCHSPNPTGVLLPDGRSLVLSMDRAANATKLNALQPGEGDRFRADIGVDQQLHLVVLRPLQRERRDAQRQRRCQERRRERGRNRRPRRTLRACGPCFGGGVQQLPASSRLTGKIRVQSVSLGS